MTQGQSMNVIWYVLVLVLVGSSLVARRLPVATMVKYALAWAAIGALLFVIVDHREDMRQIAAKIGITDQSVSGDTTRIRQSTDGHFWAQVEVNGVSRRMLIDSGATTTALSVATAKAAGIAIDDSGFPVMLDTANGTVMARRAEIKTLKLGNLQMHDVETVVSPSFGDLDVIGMNFLSRLGSWRVERGTLILEPDDGSKGGGKADPAPAT